MVMPANWDWKAPRYDLVWAERTARIKALRGEPARWAGLIAHYRDSPNGCVDFINDWGVTFDPRENTTYPFLLFERQVEFVQWALERLKMREDGLVEKSRDMGISWCCVGVAVWLWAFRKGTVVGFGSRKEDLVDKLGDPDSLFFKIRMFIDKLPWELKPKNYDNKKHGLFMRVMNAPGESVIKGEAGDNIGRGGRASIYFKDEAAFFEHPEAIDAALSQNTNVQIDVSTPNGEGNPFWRKRHGGKVKVFVFDWRDDPRKDKAWYEAQKAKRTVTEVAAEIDRDYSASISNSYIASTIVTDAMARGPADVAAFMADGRSHGGLRIGLDVARFGDDKCVLTFRRGRVLIKQIEWGKTAIDATAGRARQEILKFKERPDQIAVDVIGVGSGAADLLRAWFDSPTDVALGMGIVTDVNSSLRMSDGKNYNLRAFMWDQLRDWLPTASIPNDPDLRVSLTALRYGYKGGELLLEDKADMKARGVKSPDHADSLALTFAYPVTKRAPQPWPRDRVVDYSVDNEMGM